MGRRSKELPRTFGIRYILWMAWSNSLTILLTLQAIFLQLTLDPESIPRNWVHRLLQAANLIGIIIAQLKRNTPPGPPPRKHHEHTPKRTPQHRRGH
jgi:hypothetical protein